MKEKEPFYIGWQDEMPVQQHTFIKKFLVPIFILLPLLAVAVVVLQKPFNNHVFKLGNVTEHTGVYQANPVPMLIAAKGSYPEGVAKEILLVGYGKFGAEGIISEIEKSVGSLDNKRVTIKGSLIYGDGKGVIELTKKEESLVEISEDNIVRAEDNNPRSNFQNYGEIIDPKCYFGVMKPGEGKIHKSCAIRCISGGIPPVFRVKGKDGKNNYSIILGLDGEKINKQLLDHVGEQVSISGQTDKVNGWDVIYLDVKNIVSI